MLGKILGGVVALLALLIGLGFIMPDRVTMERETVIAAPADEIFALVSDFRAWEAWSPWASLDPDTEYAFEGEGVGHRMTWTSDDPAVGSGMQEITAMDPPTRLVTHLDFNGMGVADATFLLTSQADGTTKVVWGFESPMRAGVPFYMKPMGPYLGFFMDGMLGPQYEEGLASLKRAAEAG